MIATRRLLSTVLVGGVLAASAPLAEPAAAQTELERVEQLTRLGRTETARAALMTWWENERPDASRRDRQRALWLRGRLTVDPVQAELDFRRLIVLYPTGPFTADALFRLAQAAWAMGDEAAARDYVATLARDHRRSDAREDAEAWLADAGPLPPPGDVPTRQATAATPGPGARPSDRVDDPPANVTPPPAGSDPAAPVGAMNYYVQLGAFGEEERAHSVFEEVSAQGVDVRIVRVAGSLFTHVRVGRFAEREAAVELLEELTERGISAALVRDDRAEERIRP